MKNIAITNAAVKMPNDSAKPIETISELPPSMSEANVPARITPAAAIVGQLEPCPPGLVLLDTALGGSRIVDMLVGDPLPRIC